METKSDNIFFYSFWIWSNKFDAVMSMFCKLIEYDIWEEEQKSIKIDLKNTNDEKGLWTKYACEGKKYKIDFEFAFDAEEGKDMIHIQLRTDKELKEKIEALNLFQSMFSELKK